MSASSIPLHLLHSGLRARTLLAPPPQESFSSLTQNYRILLLAGMGT